MLAKGISALILTPEPMYGAVVPDAALYGYDYLIFSNGNLIDYDSLTDLQSYAVGTYEGFVVFPICWRIPCNCPLLAHLCQQLKFTIIYMGLRLIFVETLIRIVSS